MFLFGVTGGIGSGKSTVCRFLRDCGVPIIEADALARDLTNRLPQIRAALSRAFGPGIYTREGHLDKAKLSAIVFSEAETRAKVNRIIHPHVLDHIHAEAARLAEAGHELVGVEAALIYEASMETTLDAVVVVTAPAHQRARRIAARDGLDPLAIEQRMQAQMPAEEKAARADYVLENDGDLEALQKKVQALHRWLQQRAEAKRANA